MSLLTITLCMLIPKIYHHILLATFLLANQNSIIMPKQPRTTERVIIHRNTNEGVIYMVEKRKSKYLAAFNSPEMKRKILERFKECSANGTLDTFEPPKIDEEDNQEQVKLPTVIVFPMIEPISGLKFSTIAENSQAENIEKT